MSIAPRRSRSKLQKPTLAAEITASDDTAQRIITAATTLFSKHGYDATSTKAICDEAQVNVAAVHYHFTSKENLYRHIVRQFGLGSLHVVRRILKAPANEQEFRIRLEMFLRELTEVVIQQPDIAAMILRDSILLHQFSEDIFNDTYWQMYIALMEFMREAKKRNIIAEDVDAEMAADGLFCQFVSKVRAFLLPEERLFSDIRDEEYRNKWIVQLIRIFSRGVMERSA